MKLIPIYTWNKAMVSLEIQRKKINKLPWLQGAILLACVVIAMLLANLPGTQGMYFSILETDLAIAVNTPEGGGFLFPAGMTVEKFINDILMVVFFFTVGLEIKREIVCGELSSPQKAIMPVIAALGGVLVPALIYILINRGTAAASGWGIPTATDIAFAVGILSILGDRVPVSLKVFLTALAIADDLVAILVAIGVFRASGAMGFIVDGLGRLVEWCGGNADYVAALPTAIMKPLSGSGARGMMVDAMQTYGADSFVGRLSSIFQGATDTTFYILAVYFGSVGVRHTRHAVSAGLLTDICGVIAAMVVAYIFFG